MKWYKEKVRSFKGAKLQKHPGKQHKVSDGNSAVNTDAAYVLYNFEESDDEDDDFEEKET